MSQAICSKRTDSCSEASHVVGSLYQGDKPPVGADLTGFDLLVLCAQEWQPRARTGAFIGVGEVFHCPLDDAGWRPLDPPEVEAIMACAHTVAMYLRAKRKVLVTCNMGWNRSGVISALAMRMAYGLTPNRAIMLVRHARGPHALGNASFERLIRDAKI